MQAETRVYEILQSNLSKEEKADALCSFMNWNNLEVLEQLNKFGSGYDKDDRHRFLDHFWGRAKRSKK